MAPRPARGAPHRRPLALPGRLRDLAQLLRQARVLPRGALHRRRELHGGPRRRGVLALAQARSRLLAHHHRPAARAGHGVGAAAQPDVSRPRPRARGGDLSLRRADGGGDHHLEVAAQQPVRPRELRARRRVQLVRTRPHHGVADPDQRLAVLPLRAARGARAPADDPAGAVRSRQGGWRRGLAALRAHHAAAAWAGALRGRAPALDLDVHQVRHALAHHPGRRRRALHPHAAGLYLPAHVRLLRSRPRLGDGGADVPAAGRRGGALLQPVAARGAPVKRLAIGAGAATLVAFTAFPFAWMVLTAFKRPYEIFTTPPTFLPASFTLDNVTRLFAETRFATYLANSVLVAGATV